MPVGRSEGTAIFPLGVADFFVGDDLDPAAFADGLAGAGAVAFEPRNDTGGFAFVRFVIHTVVVRQRDVEGIELWSKGPGDVAAAGRGVGIVVSAVVLLPILIPRGFVVGSGVILGRFFADPKDGGGNELLPVIEGFLVFEGVRGRRHDRHLGPVLGRGGGDQERGEDDGERSQVGGIYHSERKYPVFQGIKV